MHRFARLVAVLAPALLLLVGAAPAQAATVNASVNTIGFTAAGEDTNLGVTRSNENIVLTDATPITLGVCAGCTGGGTTTVTVPASTNSAMTLNIVLGGGAGPDAITIAPTALAWGSSPGSAVVVVDAGDVTIVDGDNGMQVNGAAGALNFTGNGGGDVVLAGTGAVTARGGDGADYFAGGPAADTLIGDGAGDNFLPGAGADTIVGGAGDDSITTYGDGAADSITGGTGRDSIEYASAPAGISASFDGVANDGAPAEGDNLGSDLENFTGTEFADTITLANVAALRTILGRGGDDVITSNGSIDVISGGSGNDVIGAGGGNDQVWGGAGSDRLIGGPGDDHISIGSDPYDATASEEAGDDTVIGGSGDDIVGVASDGDGNDVIAGGTGIDSFGYGPDFSTGGKSAAVKMSSDGRANDGVAGEFDNIGRDVEKLIGTNFADRIAGNFLDNVIHGNGGDDVLRGGSGDDLVFAGFISTDAALLLGGSGHDSLYGLGNDRMFGGEGRDVLRTGGGHSMLSGGPGVDVARFVGNDDGFGVRIRLDDIANDGRRGQHANVRSDVENLIGTYERDVLFGRAGQRNYIDGRGGGDEIHVGSAVADRDRVVCRTGDDGEEEDVVFADVLDLVERTGNNACAEVHLLS